MQEQSIFIEALEREDPGERTEYLDRVCAGDPVLRQHIDRLLCRHRQDDGFLEAPVVLSIPGAAETSQELPGAVIGPYKLLEQIGEGGFGLVFMAEQLQPLRRKVAVKILKPGMDSRQVIARFEAERQALALMDHAHIARVLDAGETASGRPYFAMELVRGIPITDYCDKNDLTARARLELFLDVCRAVQHAHQKGIIHRDLKPSNILVTLYDGTAVAKVIDFGIAKAIGQQLTDKTLHTGFAQMIGTPLYMSPEQAEMSGLDIDTRSDIYSLGVLLYELLTGSTPFDKERLRTAGYDEMRRIIREEEPAKPSTRLSTMGQDATVVSARRQSDPKRLSQLFRGELDWIVMKALEKDRGRRYETASAFAADIERYLHDEPVSACPPSAWYRFAKMARRHKMGLISAALVSLALVVGTAVSVGLAIRATNAVISERQTLTDLGVEQQATRQALLNLDEEQKATRLELFESLVAQARANRLSRRVGQRFRTLELLRKATGMARQMNLPAERFLQLRNEAIAALALPDLRVAKEWSDGAGGQPSFDAALERYARVNDKGSLYVRRAGDGKEIHHLAELAPGDTWPGLSADGAYLGVFEVSGNRLRVWRLTGTEPAVVLDESAQGAFCFSPDSRQFARQQADGSVGILDLATGAKVRRLPPVSRLQRIMFHPSGGRLALSAQGRFAQVLDLQTGKVLWQKNVEEAYPEFTWHPDGKILGLADGDAISLWDVANDKQVGKLVGNPGGGINFTFAPGGTLLASNGWAGIVRLWDLHGNRQIFSTPLGSSALQFSADGRFLAAVHHGTSVRIWEIAAGYEYRTLVASPLKDKRGYGSVAIGPEGRYLAAGANGAGGVALWDLPSGKELAFLEGSPGHNHVLMAPLSPGAAVNEKTQATLFGMGVNGLFRWPIRADPLTGGVQVGPAQKLPPAGRDMMLAQSRDGRVLASAQFQGAVVLDADQPGRPIKLEPHEDARHIAISPDGDWAVTGRFSFPGGAKVWRARTGRPEKDLPAGEFCRPVFSPDGKYLLTYAVAAIRPVRRWEVATWTEVPFPESIEGVNAAFSPDGKLVVVETGTGVARLLDSDTGIEWARLEDPDQHQTDHFAFSPDGAKLVCASGMGFCVHVWDLQAIRRRLAEMDLDWR